MQPAEALRPQGQGQAALSVETGEHRSAEDVTAAQAGRNGSSIRTAIGLCEKVNTLRTVSGWSRELVPDLVCSPVKARTGSWSVIRTGKVPSPNVEWFFRTWMTLQTQCGSELDCARCDSRFACV